MEKQYLDYEGFEYTIERLRRKEMPEPSVDYVGQIVQYVGETSADYVKGCFYECISETDEGVVSYVWRMLEYNSKSVYDQSIEYGYRDNYESNMFKTLMASAGNLADTMLGEVDSKKWAIGPVNNTYNWVHDSLAYDDVGTFNVIDVSVYWDESQGKYIDPDTKTELRPNSKGWYEEITPSTDPKSYKKTTNGSVQSGKTYYENHKCLFWGGKDPHDVDGPNWSKYRECLNRLDLTTGEITSLDLNLYKGGDTPTGYIWKDSTAETVTKEIAFYGGYLFIALRAGTASPQTTDTNDKYGALICVRRDNLEIKWTKFFNGRCCGVNVHEYTHNGTTTVFLVLNCRMEYFNIYTIDPSNPSAELSDPIDTHYFRTYPASLVPSGSTRETDVDEQQKGCFYETESGALWYICSGFGDGIHFWDISAALDSGGKAILLGNYRFNKNRSVIPSGVFHTQDCVIEYPYVYATLGPERSIAISDRTNRTNVRRMGILTVDISELENYSGSTIDLIGTGSRQLIAVNDMGEFYEKFDTKPNVIIKVDDKLFINNSTRGVAIFDISTPSRPVYLGTKLLPEINDADGLTVGGKYLYVGDCPNIKFGKADIAYNTIKYIKGYEVYEGYKGMFAGGNTPEPTPTDDVYGALIETDVMRDLGVYDSSVSVNIKDLGATGDGVTDDSSAFATAFTQASSLGKTNILIPHGVYNLNGTVFDDIPAGVSLLGENAHACVLKDACFKTPKGITVKDVTFYGGADVIVYGSSPSKTIIYAKPDNDNAELLYERCIFTSDGNTVYASCAPMWHSGEDYDPSANRFKQKSLIVKDCIFKNLKCSGLFHPMMIDNVSVERCTFMDIGIIDDVPVTLVTNPTGNPKNKGWWEYDETAVAPNHKWFPSEDTTVQSKSYYVGKDHKIAAALLGDTSGNTVNTVHDCIIINNHFENVFGNTFFNAPDNWDMCNFVAVHADTISITKNKFKDLGGYACDREGIYTKVIYGDISYNYLENAGLGEGYICCKGTESITNRSVYIHDNVLKGEHGRGIRAFGNSVIENNTIFITDAKSGIWGSQSHRFVAKGNYIELGFSDDYVLTDEYSDGRAPTDYHNRVSGIEGLQLVEQSFDDNVIIINVDSARKSIKHYGIRSQSAKYAVRSNRNHIITNAGTGENARSIVAIQIENVSDASISTMKIGVNENKIYDFYEPIRINIQGLTSSKTDIDIKNNYVETPSNVSTGHEAIIYDTSDNETTLRYETVQRDASYSSNAHVVTDSAYIETDDISWIKRR